jgi:hypothetical protein
MKTYEITELYKQKDGDYARGNVPMPKKKKRGPHPLGGKLVGEKMRVNQIAELDRVEKEKTAGNIFMRFGIKKPIAAAGGGDEPYLVGYAGFVPSASDLKFADAKWKFYTLKSKDDLTASIKKMLADKTFTAARGVTISIDAPSLANRFPHLGEFLGWIEKASNGKVKVEYKEKEQSDKVDNKVTVKSKKKGPDGSWGSADARVEPAAKKVTRHFTVTSPRLMSTLRRNDRVMQYFKPNANEFVMGPKEFDAFIKAFGREDIKITKRFTEEIAENATAGGTSSAAMATVINPISANHKPTKRGKYGAPVAPQKLNKDGTVKNALDMSNNIMGGKPIKR